MHTVSRFEANLLRLLAYFLRREPIERAMPLLKNRCQAPPCLSRGAVELVQDALAKGCVHLLAKRGGWQNERFLRNGQVVEGRLWQRTLPEELGLSFSGQTLDFLIWITCAPAWRYRSRLETGCGAADPGRSAPAVFCSGSLTEELRRTRTGEAVESESVSEAWSVLASFSSRLCPRGGRRA